MCGNWQMERGKIQMNVEEEMDGAQSAMTATNDNGTSINGWNGGLCFRSLAWKEGK